MPVDTITTITQVAETYDLTTLTSVKLDLGIPAGTAFSTTADTPSGQVLPFAATYGITKGQQVSGTNIAPGSIVQVVGANSITLSANILGDVPSGTAILIGDDATADAFLMRAITLSSAAIQNYCSLRFAVETVQDQFTFVEGKDSRWNDNSLQRLQLSKAPGCPNPVGWSLSVSSVVVLDVEGNDLTLTEGTDFLVDVTKAQLIRICSDSNDNRPINWWAQQTTVIYTAGYAPIPSDIDDACSRMVKKAFWARGRDPSIMEQSQGGLGSTKYWVTTSPDGNLPPEICDILDKYRAIVFA
jgi:hypothetical protein